MQFDPVDDNLSIPEIGAWGIRKYHFLKRYLDLFSKGMAKKWPERHYIDLFAGAGQSRVRDREELVVTSPLIAATTTVPFSAIHLCDSDPDNCKAMQARILRSGFVGKTHVHCGDCNQLISRILSRIPQKGALCVTFADPFGLHLDFQTISAVARLRSDLIILLADNMDALRNWAKYYYDNPNSPLDRFMGESGWRELLISSPSDRQAERLRDRYRDRLQSLGYEHFAFERIQNQTGHDIYSLVYASRSPRGLDFWEKASQVDEGGQRMLFKGS